MSELLDALTDPPPCPVVVVQHMPESFTGRFAERLDRRTRLEVREARTGEPLRPGVILVAPGDAHLRIRHGRARLTQDPPVGGLRPRADLTLADLAETYGAGTTAVVLSGMGSDGYDGAVAVLAAGGQVLAQDHASCTVDGMPARIRAEAMADLIARPRQLGTALDEAWHDRSPHPVPPLTDPAAGRRRTATVTAGARTARRAPVVDADTEDRLAMERIFLTLRRLESIDLRSFKAPQLERNLRAFADQRGRSLDELGAELERHEETRRALLDRLTINVTSFFRDRERWRELEEIVIPGLGAAPTVWNPACADGSETCSLAMVLVESGRRPRIWATDVNAARIRAAEAGRYRDQAVEDLPPSVEVSDRRARWFRAAGDSWQVDPELRAAIRYQRHDALDEPLMGSEGPPFDLVVCRNLIIYLTPEGRDRLLDRITGALTEGGSVLLGNAERILRPERYGLVRRAPGLYQRPVDSDR